VSRLRHRSGAGVSPPVQRLGALFGLTPARPGGRWRCSRGRPRAKRRTRLGVSPNTVRVQNRPHLREDRDQPAVRVDPPDDAPGRRPLGLSHPWGLAGRDAMANIRRDRFGAGGYDRRIADQPDRGSRHGARICRLGKHGRGIAAHLVKAGHAVRVWNAPPTRRAAGGGRGDKGRQRGGPLRRRSDLFRCWQ